MTAPAPSPLARVREALMLYRPRVRRGTKVAAMSALAAIEAREEAVRGVVEAARRADVLVKGGALAFIYGTAQPDEAKVNEIVDGLNAALARLAALEAAE